VPVQVQIVIFAVIAAFVLFQLYNVLGKKVGRQPEDDARAQAAPTPSPTAEPVPGRPNVLDAVTLASIAGLKARDPGFDPLRFLEGARQAHETIVRAYATGDRDTLKPLRHRDHRIRPPRPRRPGAGHGGREPRRRQGPFPRRAAQPREGRGERGRARRGTPGRGDLDLRAHPGRQRPELGAGPHRTRERMSRDGSAPGGAGRACAILSVLALAACASAPEAPTATTQPVVAPASAPPVTSPAALPGWDREDHLSAFRAWTAGCGAARDAAARSLCTRARSMNGVSASEARAFFESGFSVIPAETTDGGPGLLTSYFAPEYAARRTRTDEFDAPVLAAPAGWSRGQVLPDRAAIEAAPPTAPLGWMRAEDLFFMQIQGSGYLTFEDGTRTRAAYAADNGHPFTGIARPMAEQGLLPRNGTSGDAIRGWLAAHRGPEARAVMAQNPRYIFFRTDPDDGGDPPGAAGIPLPARRSIAVDPAHWRYGDLVWIAADGGNLAGARGSYEGLVVALDTGSAIRGPVRADLYMGRGEAAGAEAGAVRHPLRMWRLVPKT
jgi:membrane-bound lytic murein transglycosylase A